MKRRDFIKTATAGLGGISVLGTSSQIRAATKKPRIKIGQIGVCHEHAKGKMDTLRKYPDIFEVVGVVDDRNSKAARFAGSDKDMKSYEGLKWMTEEELFSTPGLEAVTVEPANADLVPTAIRCMEHNLAMHMDKPGGEDLKLFKKLLDGCKKRKLPFQMGYMFRTNPAIQFCQQALHEGWLGDVFEIQADMNHDYGNKRYQKYLSSYNGGIYFNLLCHHIDWIAKVLGRPVNVTPFLRSTPVSEGGGKNNCMTVLEYPHTFVTLRSCGQIKGGMSKRSIRITGSNGTIELCPLERFGTPLHVNMKLHKGVEKYAAGSHKVEFTITQGRYGAQLLELAKIIRGEIKNPYTYAHDYLAQEILLAASGNIKWRY
ncbi:MAG: Gfo/Idh/MocA family oxidoreductase [Kiritimatiellia bacterium]